MRAVIDDTLARFRAEHKLLCAPKNECASFTGTS
jgi:hypothetical protein